MGRFGFWIGYLFSISRGSLRIRLFALRGLDSITPVYHIVRGGVKMCFYRTQTAYYFRLNVNGKRAPLSIGAIFPPPLAALYFYQRKSWGKKV